MQQSPPKLIVLHGPWGSGKSAALRALRDAVPEPGGFNAFLELDYFVHMGWPFGATRKLPLEQHFLQMHRLAGRTIATLFGEGARRVFAAASSVSHPRQLAGIGAHCGTEVELHHVTLATDETAHRARLALRDHAPEQVEQIIASRRDLLQAAREWSCMLDCSTLSPQQTAARILQLVNSGAARVAANA